MFDWKVLLFEAGSVIPASHIDSKLVGWFPQPANQIMSKFGMVATLTNQVSCYMAQGAAIGQFLNRDQSHAI